LRVKRRIARTIPAHHQSVAAIIEHDVELDRGTRLVGAVLVMPKIAEEFPAGSIIRDAALHNPIGASWFKAKCETIMATILERSDNGAGKSNTEGP
jgi:hypothetical protein